MINISLSTAALMLFMLSAFLENASAQIVNLGAAKDNTLYEDVSGNLSNGAGSNIFAGVTGSNGPGILRGLIMFDVAAQVPKDSTIIDVTLTLHLSTSASDVPDTIELRRVTGDWGAENSVAGSGGGGGGTAQNGDATWLHQFSPGETWNTPGGDFLSTVSASRSVGGFNFSNDEENFYDWTSPQLVDDVQDMLDDAHNNFGWILIGNENFSRTARRFDSSDIFTPENRPVLTIEFEAPGGGGSPADFDDDSDVDSDDLGDWANSYGGGDGGDADGDNDTDGNDFLVIQREFTGPIGVQAASVPEPTSLGLLATTLALAAMTRKRSSI